MCNVGRMDDVLTVPDFALTAALWERTAPALGFALTNHDLHLIRARFSDPHQRVVISAQGHGDIPDLILKHSLAGQHQKHFDNEVAVHVRAADGFEDEDALHVPALLHVDLEAQFQVMQAADGQTAHDLIADYDTSRATVLQACGAWMGHWHRQTYERDNRVNPNVVQASLRGLRDKVVSGERAVVGQRAFLDCAAVVDDMAEAARGQVTKLAATHGEMNLRNFIIGPQGTYGIDFGAIHTAPIGHDLARFVANFANFFYPLDAADADVQWLEDDLDAFFAGYGAHGRDDPVFRYLLRMQIIKGWASTLKDSGSRNALHRHRWAGIQLLSTILF